MNATIISSALTLFVVSAPPATDDAAAAKTEKTTAPQPESAEAGTPAPAPAPEPNPQPAPQPNPQPAPSADPFADPPVGGEAPAPTPAVDAHGHALPPKPPATAPSKPAKRRRRTQRPDRPIRWRLDLFAGGALTVAHDPAFLFFDADRTLAGPGAGVRFDVPVAGGRVFLGGGLHYQRMSAERGVWGLSNDLTLDESELFGRASWVAIEGVDLFVDLSGGLDVWRYQVGSSSRQPGATGFTGVFGGMGGIALYLPKAWLPRKGAARTTAGFEMSAGYRHRTPLSIELDPETGEDPISTRPANLGQVRTGGFSSVFSFFFRVM